VVETSNGYTRIRLPDERPSHTHKFSVGGYKGYMIIGLYPDSMKPGELFLKAAKEGSTISGLLDTIATLASMCLQSGMPLKTLVNKFKDMSFAPAGFTNNVDLPTAKSITDYVFRYLGMKYLSASDQEELFGVVHANGHTASAAPTVQDTPEHSPLTSKESPEVQAGGQAINGKDEQHLRAVPVEPNLAASNANNAHAPVCQCGTLMMRAGACWTCPNCFASTGVCN